MAVTVGPVSYTHLDVYKRQVSHLQYECPDKLFYPLSKDCVCHNMKLTTLVDVYNCLKGLAGEEIILPEEVSKGAKRCIDRMLELN